ncbi:MAG TPA: MBL fold metallo-hydrolase [Pyrinomonadaceae bacterium]|jgi:glyoxylase-like metal-dependent hydrolase (beta-lactamase superfamily II)
MSAGGKLSKKEALGASTEMLSVEGTVEIDIPVSVLWEAFRRPDWWARWNRCFYWVYNRDLVAGKKLIWVFQPIRPRYLYKMFAIANIVEVEKEKRVTWEVTALPGFYARHTYFMEDLGDGRSRFGSWEQAMGAQIRFALTRKFWTAHFTFVKDRSLAGARHLEEVYKREGKINAGVLKPKRYRFFRLAAFLLFLLAATAGIGGWLYASYLRPDHIELAPGVYAVTAGGGNSLILKDGNEVLLVDAKFPPASGWLQKWIAKNIELPVTAVVDTHYHYDHTEGNTNYPGAKIYAYKNVPDLMKKHNPEWCARYPQAIPNQLVDGTAVLTVGTQEVVLTFPGSAHTHGDLWVYLRRGEKEFIVTGDLVFHGYYPFMDLGAEGVDIPGQIQTVRLLANKYPNAVFLPGHGAPASAADLIRFADYLQFLYDAVAEARSRGLTEDQSAASIDLSAWKLSKLPSYHNGKLCWASAETNIRWVYKIQSGTINPLENCSF